ncbi:MAG: hypothetical protein U0457_14680 [Candidatus Sericytochromatia bacterium]
MDGVTVNSNFGLESLDALKAKRPVQQQPVENNSGGEGLQSLDSLRSNRETTPKGRIPANEDILAPIDAISPEMPNSQRVDTGDKNPLDFGVGMVKGFGKAAGDTVMGVVTFGKVVGGTALGLLTKPKQTLKPVKDGISFAVHNPGKALRAVSIDLPMGIVKGISSPYVDAISKGNYGEATGRAVFDVGLILMTAGMTKEKDAGKVISGGDNVADTGKTVTEVVTDTGKVADTTKKAAKGAKLVEGAGSGKVLVNSIEGGVKIGKGALKEIKDVVKVSGNGKINGPVIINIGGVVNTAETTVNAATTATRVAKTSKGAKIAKEVAQSSGAIEAISETAQASKGTGMIAIGFGEIKGAIGRGFSKISEAFKPMGSGLNNGLETILGPKGAEAVKVVSGTVGKGIGISVNAVKNTVQFVKANPVTSTIVAGKATDILTKGLQASDYYDPVPDNNDSLPPLR